MSLIPQSVLQNGMDLKSSDHVNAILSMGNTASSKENPHRSTHDNLGLSVDAMQEAMLLGVTSINADDTLNNDQKSFLIGERMEGYAKETTAVLDKMTTHADDLERSYTSKLYSNSFKMGAYQTAMMNSGAIVDSLMKDPGTSLKNEALAPVVALLTKADMFPSVQKENLEKSMNTAYSPDAVSGLKTVDQNRKLIKGAREGISAQVSYLSPSEEQMQSFRASRALRESNQKMGIL